MWERLAEMPQDKKQLRWLALMMAAEIRERAREYGWNVYYFDVSDLIRRD